MPGVYTPHVAEVAVLYQDLAGDAKCESTFYVEDNTDAIFDSPEAFATQVWDAWVAHVVPQFTSNVISTGVVFEDQRAIPYRGADYPKAATSGPVAVGSTGIPNVNSLAIKRLTSALGRSGRGRLYFPIWSSLNLSAPNTVIAGNADGFVAALTAFQAAVEGGALPVLMGVVSKRTGGAPRAFGEFNQITSWGYSDLIVDSQRRRLPGRGA